MEHRSLRLRPFLPAVARGLALWASLLGLLLASCSVPAPAPVKAGASPVPSSSPQTPSPPAATRVPRADVIRFALVDRPGDVNAWALFDEAGASYANHAVHSGLYPGLYRLSVPAREFEPYIAEGVPSSVAAEGSLFTAAIKLKPGLYWSNGSPLTASDIVFTASTALAFRLRLDWTTAYNPDVLDHVEAVNDSTVKFIFKKPFTVGDWQYGALQGPILSRAYWSPKLVEAESLLPSVELAASVEKTRAELTSVQSLIDEDTALLRVTPSGSESYKEISARLTRNQNELNSLNTRTSRLQDEYAAALNAARSALFALPDQDEPVFGPFLHFVQKGNLFTRLANPSYPFEKPHYDRVSYALYPGQDAAVAALESGQVDAVLDPSGLSPGLVSERLEGIDSLVIARSSTAGARFIVINPSNTALSDPSLRQALSCALDRASLAASLDAVALDSFVLPEAGNWKNPEASPTCSYETFARSAVNALRVAGYRWAREPSERAPGEGLLLPDGSSFPSLTLLAPAREVDAQRASAAHQIELNFAQLGIHLSVKSSSPEDIRYAVFSTGDYDMALLGWQLSDYPAYLCEWFEASGPFAVQDDRLGQACRSMSSTADLDTARQSAYQVQAVLMQDLPFIPLYQVQESEAYRGFSYPFQSTLGGLSDLYGAPGLAIPFP